MPNQAPFEPDPLDLEAFRRNGHALVDWASDYLVGLGARLMCALFLVLVCGTGVERSTSDT